MKTYILLSLTAIIVWGLMALNNLVTPIPKEYILTKQDPVSIVLKDLGCPDKKLKDITKAIHLASDQTNISPYLLCALMFTESNFNEKAVSKKNYKGLMQTPSASMEWVDVDVLHGARILQQKLKLTDGNLFQALSYYKGVKGSTLAKMQAKEVLSIYNKISYREGA
jgi:hypothetical protein